MSTAGAAPTRVVKRRRKDRREQIARASADAFSAMGYHAVSMEDIASRVGISAAALYRHSASKYQLFRGAVAALGQELVDRTAFVDDLPLDTDPVRCLDELVEALIATSIANRTSGGLYRWEGRYLNDDDQAALMGQIKLVNRRLQRPLSALRPNLDSRQRWMLSSATLSVIGSIADHRAQLPAADIREVLLGLSWSIIETEFPSNAVDSSRGAAAASSDLARADGGGPQLEAGRYEALLRASMQLFSRQHYHETSMEQIAAVVGMPASGIYRYFAGKGDMLAASFRRAADRVSGDIAEVIAVEADARRALEKLIAAYVRRSFDDPELAFVYYTERVNLPAADRTILHNVQVSTVESWVRLLVATRPEMVPERARFVVHAAFALVVDLGRMVGYDNTDRSRACVRALMGSALLMSTPGELSARLRDP